MSWVLLEGMDEKEQSPDLLQHYITSSFDIWLIRAREEIEGPWHLAIINKILSFLLATFYFANYDILIMGPVPHYEGCVKAL